MKSYQEQEKCLDELNECRARQTRLLEKFSDGWSFVFVTRSTVLFTLLVARPTSKAMHKVLSMYSRASISILKY